MISFHQHFTIIVCFIIIIMINFGGVYHCVISVVGVTSDCCEEAADDDLEEHEETSEMVDCEDGELDLSPTLVTRLKVVHGDLSSLVIPDVPEDW